jgi:hypothetical protein
LQPKPRDPSHDPFGAARPVDTLQRELEMEKRIKEKLAKTHEEVEKERESRPEGAHRGGRGGGV